MRLLFFIILICSQLNAANFKDIVITAEANSPKKKLNLIPLQDIQFSQAEHTSTIANQYAGIQIHRGNGIEHLTAIRSPVLTGGAGAGSYLYLLDGVPLRSAGFGNINGLFETNFQLAQQIEIIAGPGEVFHAPNAQHGVINTITLTPAPTPQKKLTVSSNSNKALFTTYTQSNSDSHGGYRVSADLTHDPGFRASSVLKNHYFLFRKDWLRKNLNAKMTIQAQNLDQETAGYIEGHESYENYSTSKSNPDSDAFRKSKSLRIQNQFEWELPKSKNLTITPYFRHTEMDFLMHFLPSKALEETKHSSVGLQSAYKKEAPDSFIFSAGFDFDYTQGFLKETQSIDPGIPNFPVGIHYDYMVDSFILSPFISYTKNLSETFSITCGARLDSTTYSYNNRTASDISGKYLRIPDRTNSFLAISPLVDFSYLLPKEKKVFIKLRRRSRAPQTTDIYRLESQQIPDQVNEETIDSIELGFTKPGVKISSFYMKKRNFFFRDVDGFNVVGGKTKHYGIETSLNLKLPYRFYFNLNYSYAVHKYDFTNNVASASNSTEAIQKGDIVDSAPKLFGNLQIGRRFFNETRVELEWVNMGKYYIDAANDHSYSGHNIFNVKFMSKISSNINFLTKITNIFNSRYAERADYFRSTYRYFPGEGIKIRLGAEVSF